jgi:hypothetical protein
VTDTEDERSNGNSTEEELIFNAIMTIISRDSC